LCGVFSDKIQDLDSVWDTLHTFIRIPAGAELAATAVCNVTPAISILAVLVGAGLKAGTHLTKASSRLLVNTTSNIGVSLAEDTVVVGSLLTALYYPSLFLVLLVTFVALVIWLLPILMQALKGIFDSLKEVSEGRGVKRLPEGESVFKVTGKYNFYALVLIISPIDNFWPCRDL
jgi:hypothetical protein